MPVSHMAGHPPENSQEAKSMQMAINYTYNIFVNKSTFFAPD